MMGVPSVLGAVTAGSVSWCCIVVLLTLGAMPPGLLTQVAGVRHLWRRYYGHAI